MITGDITQIDLDDPADSGLIRIQEILDGDPRHRFSTSTSATWCGTGWCATIIRAFDEHGRANGISGCAEGERAVKPGRHPSACRLCRRGRWEGG